MYKYFYKKKCINTFIKRRNDNKNNEEMKDKNENSPQQFECQRPCPMSTTTFHVRKSNTDKVKIF